MEPCNPTSLTQIWRHSSLSLRLSPHWQRPSPVGHDSAQRASAALGLQLEDPAGICGKEYLQLGLSCPRSRRRRFHRRARPLWGCLDRLADWTVFCVNTVSTQGPSAPVWLAHYVGGLTRMSKLVASSTSPSSMSPLRASCTSAGCVYPDDRRCDGDVPFRLNGSDVPDAPRACRACPPLQLPLRLQEHFGDASPENLEERHAYTPHCWYQHSLGTTHACTIVVRQYGRRGRTS